MGRWAYFNTHFSYKFGSQQDSTDIELFGGHGYITIAQDDLELAFEEEVEQAEDEFHQETLLNEYNDLKKQARLENNKYVLTPGQYSELYENTFVQTLGRLQWTWKDTTVIDILEHLKDLAHETDFHLDQWLHEYKVIRDTNKHTPLCSLSHVLNEKMKNAHLGEDGHLSAESSLCILGTHIYIQRLEDQSLGCFYES
jgi:hypothetical protein